MKMIEVLVPVAEARHGETPMAQRPQDLKGKTVGFIWNHKPNGDLLLKNVEQALKEKFLLSETMMKTKPRASSPMPLEDLEELSGHCELVILGVGDWGSCISWGLHDAVELEKRGVPTISICTDEFVSIGSLEAGTLGMPRLPLAIIPHPLGGLKPEEVAEKAETAFREIAKNLEGK